MAEIGQAYTPLTGLCCSWLMDSASFLSLPSFIFVCGTSAIHRVDRPIVSGDGPFSLPFVLSQSSFGSNCLGEMFSHALNIGCDLP